MMQVVVQTDSNYVFDFQARNRISDVKDRIFQSLGYEVDDQILMSNGRILDDGSTLGDLGIGNMDSISVFSRLLGGKVHGSLARAGKVRNQTKKTPKKEKKRPKSGRCKLRRKYHRRVLAAVSQPAFGRKRGPNSNAGK
ncbi:40S ribosomal protein S30 [Thelohanellus kitauei]|uniref:40S ribosomal protein S30 n=1 Tax=Thelohanellus kitauei TaxID=669202 RepID=A0A0C2IZA5_THEKT|nr:40S ribosomal protein S30 [Thelohanellus kitauei]